MKLNPWLIKDGDGIIMGHLHSILQETPNYMFLIILMLNLVLTTTQPISLNKTVFYKMVGNMEVSHFMSAVQEANTPPPAQAVWQGWVKHGTGVVVASQNFSDTKSATTWASKWADEYYNSLIVNGKLGSFGANQIS